MSNIKISRLDAIKIIDMATDKDDPFWENLVVDWYEEGADELPTIFDVFNALGVTKDEYIQATGVSGFVNWPE